MCFFMMCPRKGGTFSFVLGFRQNRGLIESGDLSIKSWITPTKIGDASNNKQHYRMDVSAKHTM